MTKYNYSYMGSASFASPRPNQSLVNWVGNRVRNDSALAWDAAVDGVGRVRAAIRSKKPIVSKEELLNIPNNIKEMAKVRGQSLDILDEAGDAAGKVMQQANDVVPKYTQNPVSNAWEGYWSKPSNLDWVEGRKDTRQPLLTRRNLLIAGGVGTLGAGGATALYLKNKYDTPEPPPPPPPRFPFRLPVQLPVQLPGFLENI